MPSLVGQMAEALALALFVPRCGACRLQLAQQPPTALCGLCLSSLQACQDDLQLRPDSACQRILAPYRFGGALRELVHAAKFAGRQDLLRALGTLLAASTAAAAVAKAASCVVPVPLGPQRLRQRGYNQSAGIARVLSRHFGLPLCHGLRRCSDTRPQTAVDAAQRRRNVAGAFVASGVRGEAVLLVDDVVTSGATLEAAAQALKIAGARQVWGLGVARSGADLALKLGKGAAAAHPS